MNWPLATPSHCCVAIQCRAFQIRRTTSHIFRCATPIRTCIPLSRPPLVSPPLFARICHGCAWCTCCSILFSLLLAVPSRLRASMPGLEPKAAGSGERGVAWAVCSARCHACVAHSLQQWPMRAVAIQRPHNFDDTVRGSHRSISVQTSDRRAWTDLRSHRRE